MSGIGREHACDMMPESGHTIFHVAGTCALDFGLFRNLQGVIDFDAEIANRAFELGMAK